MFDDSTFKYLLKEESFLTFFSSILKPYVPYHLEEYQFIDQELNTGNNIKDLRMDLLLRKENHLIIIEINKCMTTYTQRKNYSYLYRLAGSLYKKGENYQTPKEVTLININNCFYPKDKEKGIVPYKMQYPKYQDVIEGIESYEIYLSKYKGICYNKDNKMEAGFALLLAKSYKEARAIVGNWKEGGKVVDALERLAQDEEFGALYDAREEQRRLENSARIEGYEEGESIGLKKGESIGLKKGENIGLNKGKASVAASMLKENLNINLIAKCTGLSQQEILQLR